MPANRITPSRRLIIPSKPISATRMDTPIIMGTSRRTNWRETMSGATMADTPKIKSTLKILLPTTLPTAISACPCSAEDTLTDISGALVPNATTVSPMTSGEMPIAAASLDAPRTSNSAPATNSPKPITNNTVVIKSITLLLLLNKKKRDHHRTDSVMVSPQILKFLLSNRSTLSHSS